MLTLASCVGGIVFVEVKTGLLVVAAFDWDITIPSWGGILGSQLYSKEAAGYETEYHQDSKAEMEHNCPRVCGYYCVVFFFFTHPAPADLPSFPNRDPLPI